MRCGIRRPLLRRHELGNLPESPLGIAGSGAARERTCALGVATVMTPDPVYAGEDAAADNVIAEMDRRRVGQLPVACAEKVIRMIGRIAALEHSPNQEERSAVVAE